MIFLVVIIICLFVIIMCMSSTRRENFHRMRADEKQHHTKRYKQIRRHRSQHKHGGGCASCRQ